MILSDFAQTGFRMRRLSGDIQHFQVFGERASGTNFVSRILGRNSPLRPMDDLGWKHGFPHMTAVPQNVMVIGAVRNAESWCKSLYNRPWHTTAHMQHLPFEGFIRHEWDSIADAKRYFPQVKALGGVGTPLQHDRHPITGARFENMFALRRAKLAGLLSFMNRGCNFTLVRMEDVVADPEGFLDRFHASAGLDRNPEYKPIFRRLGNKFAAAVPDRPKAPDQMSAQDRAFMRSQLDLPLEEALGYTYDD